MLRNIHKASSTWLGKALMATVMGFLVISFAVWGIGDIFRGGFGQNAVASVGSTDISIEQFRQYYNDQLQRLSRESRRVITPDQARAMGLGPRFLQQLIAQTALDEQARKLHLGLSTNEIVQRIKSNPAFQGANGQFDPARFAQLIRDLGFTEARFIAQQRDDMLRRQIAQTVGGDIQVPNAALAALNQFQNEKRDIEYLALGPAQVAGVVPSPMPDEVTKFFDEHKAEFRAPEYRKVTLLSLSPADVAKPADVSDADAKTYYEQHKDQYGRPEKRELHQIVFPDAAQAQAAQQEIAGGATFQQVAEKHGFKPSDTDLGLLSKSQIVDPAIAEAAFSLPVDKVSEPVKGRFGTALVMVSKIEPGEDVTFEQVAPQIKQTVAEQRARGALGDMRDKVEDERAGGATLAETANKLGLKSITIDAMDRAGRDPKGQPIAALQNMPPNLINSVFASDVGVDTEPLSLPSGGFIYFDVADITPSRERTLDEVKPEVEARWRAEQIAKRLTEQTDQMLAKLKAGTPLAQVASGSGLTVQTASGLQRNKAAPNIPPSLVQAVFSTAKGSFNAAEGANPTERFVFQVTQVTDPTPDPIQSAQIKTILQNSFADDLIGQYLTWLASELGVTRNDAAMNQVIGGQTEQQ
jgi:peptidyl-prolyl cis-trans isomerase D